jgi:MFS family permease
MLYREFMATDTPWKPVYDGPELLMSIPRVKLVALASVTLLLLSLLDVNIMSAIAFKVITDLDPARGIGDLPLLTSCYPVADCIAIPLYGRLADQHGPKRPLLVSLAIFIAGSLLCGLSQNVPELIAFRTLQGLGAGGLTALTLVVTGILFGEKEEEVGGRPMKPSSAIGIGAALMFGIGLALGPTLGGLITEHLSWRWVFYLNLPFAVAALVILAAALKMPGYTIPRTIDYPGAALLSVAAVSALLVTEWGGQRYAWGSPEIIGLIIAAVVFTVAFCWRSLTAPEPLVSLSLMRNPVFRLMMPISLLAGIGLAGGLLYISGYLQIGRGLSTGDSGLMIICMAGGMLVSIPVARLIVNVAGRFKYLLVAAGIIQATVLFLFGWLSDDTSYVLIGAGLFVLGIGIGQSLGLSLQYMQASVEDADLGVATTSLRFFQQLGSAIGFGLYSTLVVRYLDSHLSKAAGPANVNGNLDTAALAKLPAADYHAAISTFIHATNLVFTVAAAISLLPGLLALLIPENRYRSPMPRQTPHPTESNIS